MNRPVVPALPSLFACHSAGLHTTITVRNVTSVFELDDHGSPGLARIGKNYSEQQNGHFLTLHLSRNRHNVAEGYAFSITLAACRTWQEFVVPKSDKLLSKLLDRALCLDL